MSLFPKPPKMMTFKVVEVLQRRLGHSLFCGQSYIFAIPANSANSERVFSTSGNMVATKQTNLDPDKVEDLVTRACNLQLLQEFESKNIVY